MASLSIGTRNLKFMQRAAAKSGTAVVDALPRAAVAAEEEAKWFIPRPSSSSGAAGTGAGASAGTGRGGVSFESSYAPFLGFTTDQEDKGEGSSRRAGGGRIAFGGFGEDEVKEEEEDSDEEDADDEEAQREEERGRRGQEKEKVEVRRAKLRDMGNKAAPTNDAPKAAATKRPRSPSPPRASTSSSAKGFIRPSNYIEPSPSHHNASSSRNEPSAETSAPPKKISTFERLKQIAKSRGGAAQLTPKPSTELAKAATPPIPAPSSYSVSESPAGEASNKKQSKKARQKAKKRAAEAEASADSTPQKKAKVDESPAPAPSSKSKATEVISPAVASSSAKPGDLDAREKELKAQRKKEAKARRKERQAQKGDGRNC